MPRGSHWGPTPDRLAAGMEVDPLTGCHVWQRARNSRGYGVLYHGGKLHLAHRVAFLLRHGRWPHPHLVTDHICQNKGCVNPDHLRELTNVENIRRSMPSYGVRAERREQAGVV